MRRLIPLLLLLSVLPLWANQREVEIRSLAAEIAALIDTEQPILLELRAGEWSLSLEAALRRELLAKGADLREKLESHSPAFYSTDPNGESTGQYILQSYGLQSALLVQISMDIGWQTVEHRRFLSYRQERKPLYNFSIKQILLPEAKLLELDSLSRSLGGQTDTDASGSNKLLWFEPIVAVLGITSIIYLLWTTE